MHQLWRQATLHHLWRLLLRLYKYSRARESIQQPRKHADQTVISTPYSRASPEPATGGHLTHNSRLLRVEVARQAARPSLFWRPPQKG